MKKLFYLSFFTLFFATAASAAVITWGSATDVSAASDVSTNGTLVEAFNAGSTTTGTDQTVNGVLFTGITDLLSNDSGTTDVFNGDTGDTAYNALLSSIDFGGGRDVTLTVGGGSLISSTLYEIQVWFTDTRYSGVTLRDQNFGDGDADESNDVNLLSSPGQFATGTFTADAINQNLNIRSGLSNHGNVHVNAYQVRVIPEPGSIVLFLLSAASMLMFLRRR